MEQENGTLRLPRGSLPGLVTPTEDEPAPLLGGATLVDETVFPSLSAGAPRLTLDGSLRDYQAQAVEAMVAAREGVIVAPTGSGKTLIALGLIVRLQSPTLILVHTKILLRQTVERIRAFLGVDAGVIGDGKWELSDLTVATVQSLRTPEVGELFERFGLVVLDEAHHCPAYSFRTVLARFAARYRVGLTATPERKDRLHPILFDVVGPVVDRVEKLALEESRSILKPELVALETGFGFFYRRNYATMIRSLTRNEARNTIVLEAIVAHRQRRSLVTTERILHAEVLAERLRDATGEAVGLVHGKIPREQVEATLAELASGELRLIVATTALIGEGFDLPDLDTLFVTVPHGNPGKTQQLLGRILRPAPDKATPLVVDFIDARVPMLRNQWRRRKKVYDG